MTPRRIGDRIVKKLTGKQAESVQVEGRWGRVAVETADIDRLGVLVREIRVERLRGSLSALMLRRRLEALSERLDYLPERLVLVEHDPARTGALMRSERPQATGGERQYFELRVEQDRSTRFSRFRQPAGGIDRQSVSTLLDRQTLARLVDDLLSAVA